MTTMTTTTADTIEASPTSGPVASDEWHAVAEGLLDALGAGPRALLGDGLAEAADAVLRRLRLPAFDLDEGNLDTLTHSQRLDLAIALAAQGRLATSTVPEGAEYGDWYTPEAEAVEDVLLETWSGDPSDGCVEKAVATTRAIMAAVGLPLWEAVADVA